MTLNLKLFAECEHERHVLLRLAIERFRYPARDVGRVVEIGQKGCRMTAFRRQFVTNEARPGATSDVVRHAVPTGRYSTGARRLHRALERRVDEVRKTPPRFVAMVTRVLRTPGLIRAVDGHDRA